jgi:hypothetical protein
MRFLSFIAIACLLAVGCDVRVSDKGDVSVDLVNGKATDEWARTYTIAKGGRLEIVNENGTIDVGRSTGSAVEVRAMRAARDDSDEAAGALLRSVDMNERVAPERVRIEARTPERAARDRGFKKFVRRPDVTIAYRVLLPSGLGATFRTESCLIRLDNVDGRFEAATTNGSISGRALSGSLTASSVNGGVQLGFDTLHDDVEITVVNGGIRIEVPKSIDAQLDATTVNGGIRVDDELPLEASARDRLRVTGRINKGGPRIVLHTTNGGVRVGVREQ